jgi:hypothetical protein
MSIAIDTELRINKACKVSELLPLMRLQARIIKQPINTRKGLKRVLSALNKSINLN